MGAMAREKKTSEIKIEGNTPLMATISAGFLCTPGELTIPPEIRQDGTQHGGVAILVTRITLAASESDSAKALLVCSKLQGAGLKTNESAIRVLQAETNKRHPVFATPSGIGCRPMLQLAI